MQYIQSNTSTQPVNISSLRCSADYGRRSDSVPSTCHNSTLLSIRTDGGPQFGEPFKAWCSKHRIRHEISLAYNHESIGHAECMVKEMKKLLKKVLSFTPFRQVLWGYCNCRWYDSLSPAQWYCGHILDATVALH